MDKLREIILLSEFVKQCRYDADRQKNCSYKKCNEKCGFVKDITKTLTDKYILIERDGEFWGLLQKLFKYVKVEEK